MKKKRSVATLESGEKRNEECSDGGKDQSRGENPRDPRRKGRLETNISSITIRAYIAVTSTCNIIRIAQSNNKELLKNFLFLAYGFY